ncbi:male-specific lethal 3 homolog [Centruroides sculpturatus]|uniref:male-specific lethal 3 homolog n=1 Tax=Centruroides sculpturatus TaxID=218467 RepID=UPI000C6D29AC|nr:male-specific lethal 3 homolog [Centruroides sculpturatus]
MVRLQRHPDPSKRLESTTDKMVSTRGVKFKFSEGEKVLCYEPDPTKAKVLYESKVLELVVSRDSKGRKAPEYRIHFYGWNSSWDRCVSEDFILPDTEENRSLQKKLAEEAAQKLNQQEEDGEKTVNITIPNTLKEILEHDCFLITQKNKLIKLPCEVNVVSVLEAYVKNLAVNLLCASPPKASKHGSRACVIPADVEVNIQLCREVMDGLRVYFDFTLPHLLLYRQERKQYSTVTTVCRPVINMKSEAVTEDAIQTSQDTLSKDHQEPPSSLSENMSKNNFPTTPPFSPSSKTRSTRHRHGSIVSHQPLSTTENGLGSPNTSPKYKILRNQHSKDAIVISAGEKPTVSDKRVLRSTERLRSVTVTISTEASFGNTQEKECSETDTQTKCEPTDSQSSPTRSSRQSTKNTTHHSSYSSFSANTSQASVSHNHSTVTSFTQRVNPPPPLNILTISNFSSSSSSTNSSVSSPTLSGAVYHMAKASEVLSEVLSWRMLPSHIYEHVPAPPSLLYGAQHLLRLFVKLPELIHRMNLPHRKLVPLLDYINNFLEYMAERKEELFFSSAYVDDTEGCPVEGGT